MSEEEIKPGQVSTDFPAVGEEPCGEKREKEKKTKRWIWGALYALPFAAFLAIYASLFSNKYRVIADKDYYLHYHMASFRVDRVLSKEHKLVVFRNEEPVKGIGDRRFYDFKSEGASSVARFPIPWNAPTGFYEARIFHPKDAERKKYLPAVFAVIRRKPKDAGFPINAVNWENTGNITSMKIPSVSGSTTSLDGIFDWLSYLEADTFFYLGGQTAYFNSSLPRDFPWLKGNLKNLDKVCAEARRRKFRIGSWCAAYIIIGSRDETLGYNYGIDYSLSGDCLKKSRGISIGDEKRLKDIVKVMRQIDLSDIDFIGIDYIRPVQGGFEMIDDFLSDMRIELPSNLKGKEERMLYLARRIFRSRDMKMADLWNWWRAHKASECLVKIKEEVKSVKPLWIFLLSWQMGHQHGQDPVMFQDAGADFETVMLYECDSRQFDNLLKQWKNYDAEGLNLVVGNQVDFIVHQRSASPPATELFVERIREAKKIMKPKGVFVNDFSRAFWGRKGPYTTIEWLEPLRKEFIKKDKEMSRE